jgi:cytochrome b subunit of formate dehydrogenase
MDLFLDNLLMVGLIVAVFVYFTYRWILHPLAGITSRLRRLTQEDEFIDRYGPPAKDDMDRLNQSVDYLLAKQDRDDRSEAS